MLKRLRRFGVPWNPKTTYWAALTNDVDVLRWAVRDGCPVHPKTYAAALRGHLEVLKILVESGSCPWCPDTIYAALKSGDYDVMARSTVHDRSSDHQRLF